jgi:hypothetical protein
LSHGETATLNMAKGALVPAYIANTMNDTDLLLAERSVSGILDRNAIGGLAATGILSPCSPKFYCLRCSTSAF